jgi:hypothetical protein
MPRRAAADSIRPVVSPLPKRLAPPPTLSEGAKAEFIRIVTSERADHFRPSDMPLLVQYTEACALAQRSVRELQHDDAKACWLTRWEKANRVLVALSARLRICPQARQPNRPTRPEQTSYYEQMSLEDSDDAQD